MNFQDDLDRKSTKFSTQTERCNTSPAGLGSVSIPESKSAAQRWFYALRETLLRDSMHQISPQHGFLP
jgi:hypothetical protein